MQPLQDVVRAAQAAEKRAKKLPGKHALALSLFKRSGEITEWSTRFDSDGHSTTATPEHPTSQRGGLDAAQWLLYALGRDVASLPNRPRPCGHEVLSAKFPYRLTALLEPHLCENGISDTLTADQLTDLVTRELAHAMDRQRGKAWSDPDSTDTRERVTTSLLAYLSNQTGNATQRLRPLLGLLATAAFLGRQPAAQAKS